MKSTISKRFHFIYEVDNIPDHRSRRFGCCPCLMAVSSAYITRGWTQRR